jgi:cytochrome c oxidase subunit 2
VNELLRTLLFLPDQASSFAGQVDRLHYFVIITTFIASAAVGLGALFFFWRYRRRSEGETTPHVEPSVSIEVAFVTVPLVFFLTWFAMGFRDFITLTTPPRDATDIYVMGKQWMWKFSYPEGPNSIDTLRVPADRPIRLLLTSRDVIHSFYVPAFRIKQDALPGRYTQTWFTATRTGRFPLFCAEYCGLTHSGMVGEVVVMPGPEFDAWLADQRRGLSERVDSADVRVEQVQPESSMVEQGRSLATRQGCTRCHSVDGTNHIGPTWLDLYRRRELLTTGQTVEADEAYLTESMMDPRAKVVAGFDPVMPSFRGQLSPSEVAALVEYIKSLRTDRVVLPRPLRREP